MLNPYQIELFHQQGYLVVENVLDTDHLQAINHEYSTRMDELYQHWYSEGFLDTPPEGLSFWE